MLNKDKVLKMYLDKDFCSNMSNKAKNYAKNGTLAQKYDSLNNNFAKFLNTQPIYISCVDESILNLVNEIIQN